MEVPLDNINDINEEMLNNAVINNESDNEILQEVPDVNSKNTRNVKSNEFINRHSFYFSLYSELIEFTKIE